MATSVSQANPSPTARFKAASRDSRATSDSSRMTASGRVRLCSGRRNSAPPSPSSVSLLMMIC